MSDARQYDTLPIPVDGTIIHFHPGYCAGVIKMASGSARVRFGSLAVDPQHRSELSRGIAARFTVDPTSTSNALCSAQVWPQ